LTSVYTITLSSDISSSAPIQLRIFETETAKWSNDVYRNIYYIYNSESSNTPRFVANGDGTYTATVEIKPTDITRNCLSATLMLGAGTQESPIEVNVQSITRTGRAAVTIKHLGDNIGWTTFCSSKCLEYSRINDLEAYIVTARNETTGELTLNKVEIATENTPVILMVPNMGGMESYTYGIPSTTAEANDVSQNMLLTPGDEGLIVPVDEYTYYAIAKKAPGVGFYKVNAGVKIPKDKAYLKIKSGSSNVRGFYNFDLNKSETTAFSKIKPTANDTDSDAIYNLQGQRISKPVSGHIYIKNGKKYLAH